MAKTKNPKTNVAVEKGKDNQPSRASKEVSKTPVDEDETDEVKWSRMIRYYDYD